MAKKKNKKKINIVCRIIGIIYALSLILFLGLVIYMDVLPTKYIIPVLGGILLISLILELLLLIPKVKAKIKIISSIFAFIFMAIFLFGSYYLYNTLDFLGNITNTKKQVENYYVVVLDNGTYDKISDLKNDNMGIYKSSAQTYKEARKKLEKKVETKNKDYDDLEELANDLLEEETDAMFVSESYKSMIEEEIEEFSSETKILYTISVEVETKDIAKNVNVTNESFNIFVSGIDTYGKISSVSRSDVNMIVTVNPKTHDILLTSIPRDYYVQLHGTTGLKDKLTHAGIYGVDMSVSTLEDLFDIDINYYVRVNFTTLIQVVDTIDGIDVESDKSFTAYTDNSVYVKKGSNHFNGKQALAYSRERYAYQEGDRHRVQNQQDVITAIMNKMLSSKTLITKYNSILNTLDGSFQTNMKTSSLTSLIKKQIDTMPSWNITSQSVNGTDSSNVTYSYPGQKLYVMVPDMSTVESAKTKITEVYEKK